MSARVKVPRASIACTLVRDPDYVRLVAENDVSGLAAIGVFVGLLCLAKDQGSADGVLPLSRVVRARLLSVDEETMEACLTLLAQVGWVAATSERLTIKGWTKWNTSEGWGGLRNPPGGRPKNQDTKMVPLPIPSPSPSPIPGRETSCSGSPEQRPPFEWFWQAYPRKIGKPKAQESWRKAVEAEGDAERLLAKALRSIQKAKRTAQWQDRDESGALRYVPHPATWLNQHRWEDDDGQEDLEIRRTVQEARRKSEREEFEKKEREARKNAVPADELKRRLSGILKSAKEA